MLASFTDITGINSTNGGTTWSFNDDAGNTFNTTYQIIQQPTTNNLYAAVSSIHDMYQWDQYQMIAQVERCRPLEPYSSRPMGEQAGLRCTTSLTRWFGRRSIPTIPTPCMPGVVNSTSGASYMTTDSPGPGRPVRSGRSWRLRHAWSAIRWASSC